MVHLTQHHMLPAQRTADLMGDLCDLPLSDATVLAAVTEAGERLEATIAQAVVATPVVHADETGMRVAGKLHWLHVLATGLLTWMGIHPNRGQPAFDAFALLTAFLGTPACRQAGSSTTVGSPTALWLARMPCATPITCAN